MSTEPKIVGYCRACGKALDETSVRATQGAIFCEQHAPAVAAPPSAGTWTVAQPASVPGMQPPPFPTGATYSTSAVSDLPSPYTSPYVTQTPPPLPDRNCSPGIAFLLGMIPGVGAVYNGQYAKGLVHVVIVGLLISILSSGSASGLEPLFGLMLACFWFYMAFEAYHTARKRHEGQPVDEFSGLVSPRDRNPRFPAGPVLLIALGLLFLLNNLEILELRRMLRYWPVLLIALGVYLLFLRVTAQDSRSARQDRGGTV